tara:strand:+ start:1697 stop:2293 length:597 start_codon:yes stop_codon:yes gene_type:complete
MANQRLADDVMNLLLMNDIANDFTYRTIITYEFNNGIWENNSPEKLTTYDVDIYFSTGSAIFKVLSISDSLHNNQLVKHIETEQYASSSSATINEFDSNGNVYSSINKGIYSNNNCSSISLSVENENILEDVSLYPNPTKSELNITGIEGNTYCQILDISGKVVEVGNSNQIIDANNLVKGIYLLQIEGHKIQKFTKD